MGMATIKNVGSHAIESILQERRQGPFRDLFDFCRRVDLRTCNRRVIESLIQCGAMDDLPGHRARLLAMLDEAMEQGGKYRKQQSENQLQLFDEPPEGSRARFTYDGVKPFTSREELEMERELLGLYLSGHPLDPFRQIITSRATHRLGDLSGCREEERVTVGGLVREVKAITTRKGEPMAFVTLEDHSTQVEVVVFPRTLRQFRSLLQTDQAVLVTGRINGHEQGNKVLADRVEDLQSLPKPQSERVQEAQGEATVYIRIPSGSEGPEVLGRLKRLLLSDRGGVPVRLFYEGSGKLLELPVDRYGVLPSDALKRQVEGILGTHSFRMGVSSRTSGGRES